MQAQFEIIRTCSSGSLRIDTRHGRYWLSPADIRELLFFCNQVPLHLDGGIIDGEAIAYPHHRGTGIIIALFWRVYHINRADFVSVAGGEKPSAPILPMSWNG